MRLQPETRCRSKGWGPPLLDVNGKGVIGWCLSGKVNIRGPTHYRCHVTAINIIGKRTPKLDPEVFYCKVWENITRPSVIYVENVHFDWFNQYVCSVEHFQSDLDIFQFDFMFMKPHDVPPLLCLNVQTEMRFDYNSSCFQRVGVVKRSCYN